MVAEVRGSKQSTGPHDSCSVTTTNLVRQPARPEPVHFFPLPLSRLLLSSPYFL